MRHIKTAEGLVVQQEHSIFSLEAKACSIGELKGENTRLNTMSSNSSASKDVFLNKTKFLGLLILQDVQGLK